MCRYLVQITQTVTTVVCSQAPNPAAAIDQLTDTELDQHCDWEPHGDRRYVVLTCEGRELPA